MCAHMHACRWGQACFPQDQAGCAGAGQRLGRTQFDQGELFCFDKVGCSDSWSKVPGCADKLLRRAAGSMQPPTLCSSGCNFGLAASICRMRASNLYQTMQQHASNLMRCGHQHVSCGSRISFAMPHSIRPCTCVIRVQPSHPHMPALPPRWWIKHV